MHRAPGAHVIGQQNRHPKGIPLLSQVDYHKAGFPLDYATEPGKSESAIMNFSSPGRKVNMDHARPRADTDENGNADTRGCFATQIAADDFHRFFLFICVNPPLSAFICVLYFT